MIAMYLICGIVCFLIFPLFFLLVLIKKDLNRENKKAIKYEILYKLMVQWMEAKQDHMSIKEVLDQKGYRTVAIYGMFLIGERLYIELKDNGVDISYCIDQKNRTNLEGITIYKPSDFLPQVDVVIVTAVADFEVIKKNLRQKMDCPILSFDELINELTLL